MNIYIYIHLYIWLKFLFFLCNASFRVYLCWYQEQSARLFSIFCFEMTISCLAAFVHCLLFDEVTFELILWWSNLMTQSLQQLFCFSIEKLPVSDVISLIIMGRTGNWHLSTYLQIYIYPWDTCSNWYAKKYHKVFIFSYCVSLFQFSIFC